MTERQLARKKAIIRRRIFLGLCFAVLVLIIALVAFIIKAVVSAPEDKNPSEITSSDVSDVSLDNKVEEVEPQVNEYGLDVTFSNLLLVNGKNPLPDDYDKNVREFLVEIDPQYRNNNYVTKIHKDVYPYITAMVAKAQKDGVDLKVWSPFRSYADQKVLFENKVKRVTDSTGLTGDAAEKEAATVVARPGTSEHNTGLCADFNMASSKFADTEMYKWMTENAEDFGFIMRYREDKQPITGVIHESWHWRFVGINVAKDINRLDMCLEEYVEYLEKNRG